MNHEECGEKDCDEYDDGLGLYICPGCDEVIGIDKNTYEYAVRHFKGEIELELIP